MATGPIARVAAALTTTAMIMLAGCGGAGDDDPAPSGTTTPSAPAAPGNGGSAGIGEPPADADATEDTVAVYYLGDEQVATGGGSSQLRLYREFRQLEVGDGAPAARIEAALAHLLTSGSALDPDYRSGWPESASVNSVEVTGSTARVDLAGAGSHQVGAEGAELAVAQLVWTATAEDGVDAVRLLLDGAAADELWGHVGIDRALTRGSPTGTVALLWLISPQHGQTVPGTFQVHIYGAPFEATAQLRVRQEGTVVHEQHVTLGGEGFPEHFGEAKVELTLDPGRYTLEVFEYSARDGSEIRLDDKTVTVS